MPREIPFGIFRARRGNAFYGEMVEQNPGAGHNGNSVDIAQRYAQSEADKQAEEEEFSQLPIWAALHPTRFALQDLAKRDRFSEYLRKKENGELEPMKPVEPKEEPSLSRAADDKFWSDKNELQRVAKQVRNPKL